MNKQQLAAKIWESANKMRSKIEANEYKDYILGFMFYKYLSDLELRFLEDQGASAEEIKEFLVEDYENPDAVMVMETLQSSIGYFIEHKNLFSTWVEDDSDFDVADVRDALKAFKQLVSETYKPVFDKIFDTLEAGLSKLGDTTGKQTKAIRELLKLIKDIPTDGKQDYDVLGYIYEYLIEKFASNAGKKAGEFYTPHEVSLLMSEIVAEHLKDRKEIQIFDPTSGSGSLLINIGKSIEKHIQGHDLIKYYAQELKENTYNLTRMNLVMRGIKPANIITRNADTLEDDWPIEENGVFKPLRVDAVVSNPPYSQAWDPEGKENDPRYSSFGLAPRGKADYAFLLHDLYHVKHDGIMCIVLPHGVLFRGGEEGAIRQNLIEKGHVDAIIGLPANIFFGTGIPTIVIVLKQQRDNNDTLIIDASKGFIKEGKNNKLQASDIRKIVDTVKAREDVPKFAKVVSKEEIRANDYNLNIPRYVDSSEAPETWDVYSSMFGGFPKQEVELLEDYWKAFPNLKAALFEEDSASHYKLKAEEIKAAIENNEDIQAFKKNFEEAFTSFAETMKKDFIHSMEELSIPKEEEELADEIFLRLENVPLVDRYKAFQLLKDEWNKVSSDLEIIQTEGKDCIRKVEPKIVLKKQKNKEVEVQDGWFGKIIPFDLVEKELLVEDYEALQTAEEEYNRVTAEKQEVMESFTEDEKEDIADILNNDNSAFATGPLTAKVKELKKEKKVYEEESVEARILQMKDLLDDEKKQKKDIQTKKEELLAKAKEKTEVLTEEEMEQLLYVKWIQPIMDGLQELPEQVLETLETKIQALADKYETTFADLEAEIKETEQELAAMIDELVGSPSDMEGLQAFKALLGGN